MVVEKFIHRDISWLQFNIRVLDEANDLENPLMERLKFLSITASNLDEFFMIRLSSLVRSIQNQAKLDPAAQDASLKMTYEKILQDVLSFHTEQVKCFQNIKKALNKLNVEFVFSAPENSRAHQLGKALFSEHILPQLSAPEPFGISKLSSVTNLQTFVVFEEKSWIKVPKEVAYSYSKFDADSGKLYIFFLDDLLKTHTSSFLYLVNMQSSVFRLSRDGDFKIALELPDPEAIPSAVRTGIGTRERGRPLRLQYLKAVPEALLDKMRDSYKLEPLQCQGSDETFLLNGLFSQIKSVIEFLGEKAATHTHPPVTQHIPEALRNPKEIFKNIRRRDYLLHQPYDSFDTVVGLVLEACKDVNVTMIEQTIYRTDAISPMMNALKKAAKNKKVRVFVELRARFDELNNLRLADELRAAGVEVAFGLGKLKLHAKMALITRKEDNVEVRYTHLSTGNYHAGTARQYTDLALLTANPEIGADARLFFDSVLANQTPPVFKRLVHAPVRLHRRILQLIEAETQAAARGVPARIFAKVNALVDNSVVEMLYKASNAGVKIDLVVRGACSLVPGVPGQSENIRVISIVDKFLEHSRIYYFESSQHLYISSADWMPRNFFSRLELAYPVLDTRLNQFITNTIIPAYLADNSKAWELHSTGKWKKLKPPKDGAQIRSQTYFEELAKNGYKKTPLEN